MRDGKLKNIAMSDPESQISLDRRDFIKVFGGGIIPKDDIPWLKERGIQAIFIPGASTEEIIEWVNANINPKS